MWISVRSSVDNKSLLLSTCQFPDIVYRRAGISISQTLHIGTNFQPRAFMNFSTLTVPSGHRFLLVILKKYFGFGPHLHDFCMIPFLFSNFRIKPTSNILIQSISDPYMDIFKLDIRIMSSLHLIFYISSIL